MITGPKKKEKDAQLHKRKYAEEEKADIANSPTGCSVLVPVRPCADTSNPANQSPPENVLIGEVKVYRSVRSN